RVLYNEMKRRLAGGSLTAQRMLIPETVTVTPAESAALLSQGGLLRRLGMEVVPFGPDSIAVQQFPSLLVQRHVGAAGFLRELLDRLTEDETTDPERLLEDLLAMMACKAAVKAGDPLSPAEINHLLAAREGAEKSSACPHGRPTTLKLTLKDLERQFKRT
ncbi:MAG TPA: DNA mismatch repair protein MutL, partial [Phycisphaerae bacterium]|nr:DNA mismatch repair protein MutL [Phycisphaerae bacterium]